MEKIGRGSEEVKKRRLIKWSFDPFHQQK